MRVPVARHPLAPTGFDARARLRLSRFDLEIAVAQAYLRRLKARPVLDPALTPGLPKRATSGPDRPSLGAGRACDERVERSAQ